MINNGRRDVYETISDDKRKDKDEKDRNDANDDKKENIYKKFYASDCHAEGTGYEPPVLALRLDTPVIIYWDYIILDRLVDCIFREVFTTTNETPKLRVLIHQHLNISTMNKRFVVVKRRLSVLATLANIRGLNLTNL